MMKPAIFLSAALIAAAPAWAINKCTGSDGKAVFQDAPCAGKGEEIVVRPASGHAPVAPTPTAAAPAGTAAVAPAGATAAAPQKKEGAFGESWQRRTFLENRGVPDARAALQAHRNACDSKQRELSSQKSRANNNLAGATWLQSISTEMQAAATICEAKTRELQGNLEGLEKELRQLQAKQ